MCASSRVSSFCSDAGACILWYHEDEKPAIGFVFDFSHPSCTSLSTVPSFHWLRAKTQLFSKAVEGLNRVSDKPKMKLNLNLKDISLNG